MKKLLFLPLLSLLLLSMSLSAFAAGGFVVSPSGNEPPEIIDKELPEGCTAEVIVTPYSDRVSLGEEGRKRIEDAYRDIVGAEDIGELNDKLASVAEELNINTKDLSVSDLFNIHIEGCDDHDLHGAIAVRMKAETLENFVSLLYYNGDTWEFIDASVIGQEGNILAFDFELEGPYAVVVDTSGSGTKPPQLGDSLSILLIVMIVASATGLIAIAIGNRKQKA